MWDPYVTRKTTGRGACDYSNGVHTRDRTPGLLFPQPLIFHFNHRPSAQEMKLRQQKFQNSFRFISLCGLDKRARAATNHRCIFIHRHMVSSFATSDKRSDRPPVAVLGWIRRGHRPPTSLGLAQAPTFVAICHSLHPEGTRLTLGLKCVRHFKHFASAPRFPGNVQAESPPVGDSRPVV